MLYIAITSQIIDYRWKSIRGDNFGCPIMVTSKRGDSPNVVMTKNAAQFLILSPPTKSKAWSN